LFLFVVTFLLSHVDWPWFQPFTEWFLDISKALLVVIILGMALELPGFTRYFEERLGELF
jgi:hypothetical protein